MYQSLPSGKLTKYIATKVTAAPTSCNEEKVSSRYRYLFQNQTYQNTNQRLEKVTMWPYPKIEANIGVKKVSELSLVRLPAIRDIIKASQT